MPNWHRPTPEMRRERYQNDPEYKERCKRYSRETYKKLRKKLIAGYGSKCVCCGETEPDFLELDHVNGGGASEYRKNPPLNVYRRLVREHFPEGYQLLCSNCNLGRWRNGGLCPHKSVE